MPQNKDLSLDESAQDKLIINLKSEGEMARVTVEDCIRKVSNRFDLVVFAVQRGRELSAGDEPTIDRDNDKNTVVSLREIAESTVDIVELRENLIISMQKQILEEETEDKEITSETEDNIINDVEKNADKFGMQVQEKYEDI